MEHHIHHTIWCFNANSGDTVGLISYDFTTWEEDKYNLVKPALLQKGGKFVGLEHKIPLDKKWFNFIRRLKSLNNLEIYKIIKTNYIKINFKSLIKYFII